MSEKDNEKPYVLDPISEEQYEIYKHIQNGENVIGDACAGSGKSTTILSIATLMPQCQFIQLTYNSVLCSEIKTKVTKLGLENLKVYTYHSLVVKYYRKDGYTDTLIRRVLDEKVPPRQKIPIFKVIVIDEAQDMTFLYFKLIVKFCRDMGEHIQLLVLGDFMQGLYEFKGADIRFLTCADGIWESFENLCSPIFHRCSLKMSYRITNQMADFVNNVMLGHKRLYACRDGVPVVYLRRSTRDAEKYVVHKIKTLLSEGANPSEFFVLAASVKGENSAIRRMENILVENNIPCHVPLFENEKIDERVIEGKVVFSTFHSVKGRQRKYVFVMGFDQSYFNYFARNLPHTECPNTLYVACTRATHCLFVIEKNEERQFNRPLRFLKMNHVTMKNQSYVQFNGMPQTIFHEKPKELDENGNSYRIRNGRRLPAHVTTPTDLIKFIPESIIEEITPILTECFKVVSPENDVLDIPNIFKTRKGFHEDVCDLNGIAIPMMYFEKLLENPDISTIPCSQTIIENGGILLRKIIEYTMAEVKKGEHSFLRKVIEELPEKCNTISEYLRLANVYVAVKEKLYFKLNQIQEDEYDWISEEVMNEGFKRMHNIFGYECFSNGVYEAEMEKTIIHQSDEVLHKKIDDYTIELFPNELFRFTARVDIITNYCVWEMKCTNGLVNDHLLQVIIYAWLWRMVVENIEKLENVLDFRIFNIKTGEIMRLEATTDQLNTIMVSLLKGKYGEKPPKEDGDFIKECKDYILSG